MDENPHLRARMAAILEPREEFGTPSAATSSEAKLVFGGGFTAMVWAWHYLF